MKKKERKEKNAMGMHVHTGTPFAVAWEDGILSSFLLFLKISSPEMKYLQVDAKNGFPSFGEVCAGNLLFKDFIVFFLGLFYSH